MAKAEPRSITRRSLVAAFALPVAAVPSFPIVASPSDPIFAAIEAHRGAYAKLNAFLAELAAVEQAAWQAPRGQRRAANKRLAEAYAAERSFGNLESDAVERLVSTIPQTLQGAAAALAYVRQRYAEGEAMCEEEECMTLLASIEQAICRAAGLAVPKYAAPAS
jgi:hypothetical protein